ncbi:hypothetical protein GCM10010112_88990 [Actinoplanes lobatus]|uniref:DUF4262 domain-containing protein n=1 Tax=Actinoplanes lobatus TaxID=113568 RepID=A0A7W7HNQ4_9ACTN|nr:DUF4262 domain-containing protein [Actinoplanes lobatus]MBB4753890.1 hypothetical protein [Actinoplanes lobatus]GGN97119.1 hypothetical protein GCM10010112_88990 [Actinoplanes lobatus]GIE45505.1 hypothetical protein Alo02nite_84030 [Actinoplanes lobatus]
MTDWIDPRRDCSCHICERNRDDDGCRGWRDATAKLVKKHDWSVVGNGGHDGVPSWVYTVGLWHRLGSPEIAMFGLDQSSMQRWLNRLGDQILNGRPLGPDRRVHDVLDGFPLEVRPVHPAWYQRLFGSALNFYRRPPLPIVQLVWPDRNGVFPWEEGCGDNCRADQPVLWLPPEENGHGLWADLDEVTPWPFPADGVRAQVFTLKRIVEDGAPVRGVVHDTDGSWQFVDGGDVTADDIRVVHLHHLLARHPRIREVAGLAPGERAWLNDDGAWERDRDEAE